MQRQHGGESLPIECQCGGPLQGGAGAGGEGTQRRFRRNLQTSAQRLPSDGVALAVDRRRCGGEGNLPDTAPLRILFEGDECGGPGGIAAVLDPRQLCLDDPGVSQASMMP